MKKAKRFLVRLSVITLSLVACWFIGQKTHPDNPDVSGEQLVSQPSETSQPVPEITEQPVPLETEQPEVQAPENEVETEVENTIDLDKVVYEGNVETADNPWGITAGTIDLEDRGKSVFLTPNTSVLFEDMEMIGEFSFSYEIHPWVKESSDGAGLTLWLMNREEEIIHTEILLVESQDAQKEFVININEYDGVEKVKFLCDNGTADDDSGDWIIVHSIQ